MKIKVSPKAINDIDEIKKYIRDEFDNSAAANRVAAKIRKSYKQLKMSPYMGKSLDSMAVGMPENDFRFLVCGKYLIFYKVSGDIISVDHVFHGRRDYCRLLFEGETTEEIPSPANIDTTKTI